jgi:hypothetical protein
VRTKRKLTIEEVIPTLRAPFEPRVFTKECIIRWRIAKDVNKKDEMKI